MGEMIPQSHEKQAILGKMAEGQKAVKIDSIARETLNVMYVNPVDDVAKRKIDVDSGKIVEIIGNGAKSVEDLNSILVDENKTDTQKEIAKEGKEMLAKGVFIAMQYGMNNEMMDLLGKGSAVQIDKKLPEPLKGLGEEILKNIITNEQVLGVLKELDKKTVEDGWDLMPPTKEEKKLVLEASARELAKLGKVIPAGSEDRDQLIMAISYLQTELLDLNEGTNIIVQQNSEIKREEDKDDDEGIYLRGEIKNLPKEKEPQMALARKILDIIEFRQLDPWSIDGAPYRGYLDNIRENSKIKEVKQEIETRLRLQKIQGLMQTAGGWLEGGPGKTSIMDALTRAQGESGLFTVDDMRFLLKGKTGLSKAIADAWDIFEEINVGAVVNENGIIEYGSYHKILLDILEDKEFCRRNKVDQIRKFIDGGTEAGEFVDKEGMWADAYDNYFLDANVDRKRVVRAFMAEKIRKNNKKMTKYEAEKGVELAWNLMWATGETSIFNTVFAQHNDLSEFMLTKLNTLDRMSGEKQKTIGAMTCMSKITSIAPTWLRYMSDRTVFGVLKAEDIKIYRMEEVTKYDIDYWYSSMVTQKISELEHVMRSEELSPKELINPAKIKKIGEWISKAAKFSSVILDENGKAIYDRDTQGVIKNGELVKDEAEHIKINGRTIKKNGIPVIENKTYEFDRPLVITGLEKEKRSRRIRFLLVAGWAEQAMSNIDLGWDQGSWKAFGDILTREYAFDEENPDNKKSFVTKEEMDYIDKVIMNKLAGGYPSLKKFESIRESRKKGTWTFLKAEPKSFNI